MCTSVNGEMGLDGEEVNSGGKKDIIMKVLGKRENLQVTEE